MPNPSRLLWLPNKREKSKSVRNQKRVIDLKQNRVESRLQKWLKFWQTLYPEDQEISLSYDRRLEAAREFLDSLRTEVSERKIFIDFLNRGGAPTGIVEQILQRWYDTLEYY